VGIGVGASAELQGLPPEERPVVGERIQKEIIVLTG
jgi:hypothetical protein